MLPDLYAIDGAGRISRLEECPSGGEEDLRPLLERNPGLLPGSSGTDSGEWLLLGRDLHPEPSGVVGGWSVDYLYVNPQGVLTFVDCKCPFEAKRRHEVIGQMLEYAAMAQTSWDEADLRAWLRNEHNDPDDAVATLLGDSGLSQEDFLQAVIEKLKAGRFRLVFLVAAATPELLRVVGFLNQQMEKAQVFVVEARQYRAGGVRILVPAVFGPGVDHLPPAPAESEPDEGEVELEMAGVESAMEELDERNLDDFELEAEKTEAVDEGFYFEELESRLAGEQLRAVRTFYEVAQRLAFDCRWGNGDGGASLEIALAQVSDKPLLGLRSDGTLTLNFDSLGGDPTTETHQQRFRSIAHNRLDLVFHLDEMHPALRPTDWCPKLTGVLRVLDDLAMMAGQTSQP